MSLFGRGENESGYMLGPHEGEILGNFSFFTGPKAMTFLFSSKVGGNGPELWNAFVSVPSPWRKFGRRGKSGGLGLCPVFVSFLDTIVALG